MNRLLQWCVVGAFLVFTAHCRADEPARTLVVPASPTTIELATALPEGLAVDPARVWQLVEVDRPDVTVPVQLVPAVRRDGTKERTRFEIMAAIPPRDAATGKRRFRLVPASKAVGGETKASAFRWKDVSGASLGLWEGDRPVLVYNHGPITNEKVPKKDGRRTRGCYFHPVYGLNGEVLTDDFPRDHYHHHGIFWAWPYVTIDGKNHDLWTGRGIRLARVGSLGCEAGPCGAVMGEENGWFVGEKKVMIERVWLRVHPAADGAQALDLQMAWIPVDRPITLRGANNKSYGGLTVRFLVKDQKRTTITVPAGVAKRDLPETRLPWADLTYPFAGAPGPSGASIMISPNHPGYPPMWLTRHYGPMCVGYPGTTAKTFTREKPLYGSYRIWIHKDSADLARLKQAYETYEAGTKATWEQETP